MNLDTGKVYESFAAAEAERKPGERIAQIYLDEWPILGSLATFAASRMGHVPQGHTGKYRSSLHGSGRDFAKSAAGDRARAALNAHRDRMKQLNPQEAVA